MPSFLARVYANRNYRRSAVFGVAALLWLISGQFRADTPVTETADKAEAALTKVKVRYVDAQIYSPSVHVRARTEARRQVSMRAEISGRLTSLPVREGQRVVAGATVCELAVEDREARLREARSAVERAQIEYQGAQRLREQGLQSPTVLAASRAALDSAQALLERAKLELANTSITAPFAGVIERHTVDVGSFLQRGDECARLLELDPIIIAGRVSEAQVDGLELGRPAVGTVLNGIQIQGQLVYLGHQADDQTRTFRVEVAVANPDLRLRSGVSVDLDLPLQAVTAQLIPSSLLSLDDQGRIGVRIVDEEQRVQFVHVTLIGDHAEGVWVSGLPQRTLLITVGQEYVSTGERVVTDLEPTIAAR